MRKRFLFLIVSFGVAIVATSFNIGAHTASAIVPGVNTMVSVSSSGTSASNNGAGGVQISGNSKYAVFTSNSNTIVTPDATINASDVFVRNLQTNITTMVDRSTAGVQANASSGSSYISETGRYILFNSMATNLIDGTTTSPGTYGQLYIRDTLLNTTSLAISDAAGNPANNWVANSQISSDGRFLLFTSPATNLDNSVTNTGPNAFMLDRDTGAYKILNRRVDGTLTTSDVSKIKMNCDGSLIVFQSSQYLITSQPYRGKPDIYLVDRRGGDTMTNLTYSTNSGGLNPSISCNGNYIGFMSYSTNIPTASGVTGNNYYHDYVYDRTSKTFDLVDQSSTGALANTSSYNSGSPQNSSDHIAISNNGIAIFSSPATNLTTISNNGWEQMYVRNLSTGVTELLSQNSSGTAGNRASLMPSVSNSGKLVVYDTPSTNLVSTTDTNNAQDSFLSQSGY